MSNTSTIEIAVAYHDKSLVITNECLLPIQVGKDCTDLVLDMQGDNTGENISYKNKKCAEFTAIYWLWKNSKADIKGLFHYRRFLDVSQDNKFGNDEYVEVPISEAVNTTEFLNSLDISQNRISEILKTHDFITRKKGTLLTWSNYTVREHYAAEHLIEHLDLAIEAIKNLYPSYYDIAIQVLNGHEAYFTNMFIMRSELFEEYSLWIFNILDYVEEHVNQYNVEIVTNSKHGRWLGFVGERLSSIFFEYQKLVLHKKIFEAPAIVLVPNKGVKFHEHNTTDISKGYGVSYQENQQDSFVIINNIAASFPKVSVLIAAYNVAPYIEKALNSVINQTLKNIEIIVVNDGSKDETLGIVESIAKSDNRIKVIDQENSGLGIVRNRGIMYATGEYVHFMDGDDFMDDRFLEMLVKNADKYNSDIVLTLHRAIDSNTHKTLWVSSLPYTLIKGNMNWRSNLDVLLAPGHMWDRIFRRSLLNDVAFSDGGGEDIVPWWLLITKAQNVSICNMCMYNYLIRGNSNQSNTFLMLDTFRNAKIAENIINGYKDSKLVQMFKIYKVSLILHMLWRCWHVIKSNDEFQKLFFIEFKNFLNLSDFIIDDDIANKAEYYHGDRHLVISLIESKNITEWMSILINIYEGSASHQRNVAIKLLKSLRKNGVILTSRKIIRKLKSKFI